MRCDICDAVIREVKGNTYVDGKTVMGPWACMCEDCFVKVGYDEYQITYLIVRSIFI